MSEHHPLRDRITSPTLKLGALVGTLVRLGVASLIVGALLAIFRLDPIQMWKSLWHWMRTGLVDLFGTGIEGVGLVITLVLTGAVIVIPVWLIGKLLGSRKR